ncbi:MAG: DUF397 domain-containing protein [Sciscionella sp.]
MANKPRNGIAAGMLPGASWRKSSHSGAIGNCVELAPVSGGAMAIRNSRDPNGPALVYPCGAIAELIADVTMGEPR